MRLTESERAMLRTATGHGSSLCRDYGCVTCEANAAAVEAIVAARLADHRRDWANWLDGWVGAVTPTPPTPEAVVEWLRADHLPFGVSAAQPTTTEAS